MGVYIYRKTRKIVDLTDGRKAVVAEYIGRPARSWENTPSLDRKINTAEAHQKENYFPEGDLVVFKGEETVYHIPSACKGWFYDTVDFFTVDVEIVKKKRGRPAKVKG